MTTTSHTRTTRIALAALALPAAIATLAACTGDSGTPNGPTSSSSAPTVPTSASHRRPSAPTGQPTTVAPPTGTKTTDAPRTPLSTPAEVTDAYARVSLGDEALWSGGKPSRAEALTRIEPYLDGRLHSALLTGPLSSLWQAIAFSPGGAEWGHTTGVSSVNVSGADCHRAGANRSCTETALVTVFRTGKPSAQISRSIHVWLAPASVKGGAKWSIVGIKNVTDTDDVS